MRIGLVLASGAARGWAHLGVLRALEEMNVKPDIIAGASAGALVGGAHLLGELDALEAWASALGPLKALNQVTLNFGRGGFLHADRAFDLFRDADRRMEDLEIKFGAVATDLATGEEVELTSGSVIEAVRASTAVPVLFQSVQVDGRWLIDGALANPMPVSLARNMGADFVIASDLNAHPRVLERFDAPPPSPPVPIPPNTPIADSGIQSKFNQFLEETRRFVSERIDFAKARNRAEPHMMETIMATADIFQAQLTAARLRADPPDVHLDLDLKGASPISFDGGDDLAQIGYSACMAEREKILAAANTPSIEI